MQRIIRYSVFVDAVERGIMVQEFLNFVDETTKFGKEYVSAVRLFELFCEKKKLGANHAYGFRIRLQKKGIL